MTILSPRRLRGAAIVVMLAAGSGWSAPFAHAISQESAEAALAALGAESDVEKDLVRVRQEIYRRAALDRDVATRRTLQVLADIDALVQSPEPPSPEVLAAKQRELAETERLRSNALERARDVLERIVELQERIAGLEKKMAALRETLPRTRETLSGTWAITYLPALNRGVIVLRQTGTIVQGQYQLDGGWNGSLQGTFIDGKVYLQRIDSKLGRSSELQGYLSPDGRTIRGTWQNYNLTDGGVSAGSWSANRQVE